MTEPKDKRPSLPLDPSEYESTTVVPEEEVQQVIDGLHEAPTQMLDEDRAQEMVREARATEAPSRRAWRAPIVALCVTAALFAAAALWATLQPADGSRPSVVYAPPVGEPAAETFGRRHAEIAACLAQAKQAPVAVVVDIDRTGAVTSASVEPTELAGTKAAACVREVARDTRFAPRNEPSRERLPVIAPPR